MTRVEISAVRPCECPAHARIELRDRERGRKLCVRVHAPAGEAIAAELASIPSARSGALDLARDALAAVGATLESITIWHDYGSLFARACAFDAAGNPREFDVEPCEALVAACRLKLALFVDEPDPPPAPASSSAVPEVYRAFVDTLDFQGVGEHHAPEAP